MKKNSINTGWTSTQFWFSVIILAIAQWALVAGLIDGAMWTGAITIATAAFGVRKVVEHYKLHP